MNGELCRWAIGTIFALTLGAYGYTNRVDNLIDLRIEKSENRVVDRLKGVEEKLDRLIERR